MRRIDVWLPIIVSLVLIAVVSVPIINGSVDKMAEYGAGVAALVTSWIGLYFSVIRSAMRRPVLKAESNSGTIVIEKKEGRKTYLRLKVSNTGQTVARNCVGRLLEIRDHLGKPIQYDPFYFFWARQDDVNVDFTPSQIYAGDADFMDIVRIRHKDRTVKLRISTKGQFVPQGVYFPLEEYYLLVGIFADGTIPCRAWYQVAVDFECLENSYLKKVKFPPKQRKH